MIGEFAKKCVVRPMQLADMQFLLRITAIAEWNQVNADWRRYIHFEPIGCFIAEYDGRPVGTVTTLRYEDKIGWIGMLIVHPEARGLGIGSALMKHAIDYLKYRVQTIKLDATAQGLPVYKKLGFKEEFEIVKLEGKSESHSPPSLPNISLRLLPKIIAFDKIAFGASRETVLKKLVMEYQKFTFSEMHDKVSGYIMATRGRHFWHIGPWVAENPGAAENLLNAMLLPGGENRFVVDVPQVNDAAISLCATRGFKEQRRYVRMYLGENKWPGNPSMVYATGRAEKG